MNTAISTGEAETILQKNLDYTFFSWSIQNKVNPINVATAKGVYLYDQWGKEYIDFSSQLMNMNIGHGHPAIAEAVTQQMNKLSYVAPSLATEVRGNLGERLASVTPGNLKKTFFTLGGAEAIENAIKLARLYTGRHKIITHYRSYHGATNGAISAGGDPRKLQVDQNQLPNIIHVENPYFYRCPWYSQTIEECGERALRNMEQVILYEGPENVAAILIEGESGTSGCIKYPPFYWRNIKSLAEKYGILTIDDEVMSGFGRTGKWFGIDHHQITPDIMCMAKGLTAGYIPMGAMTVSDEIAKTLNDRYLPLGLTYSAHAVSCAAALSVLDVYEREGLIERADEIGRYIDACVGDLQQRHPSIGDWRNTGMLGCIELVKNKETKEPMAPWNASPTQMGVMKQVSAKIRELGMFTFIKWNFIFIAPPLTISKTEVDKGMDIITKALNIADKYCD